MENDLAIKVENVSKLYKLYDKPVDRLKETLNPLKKKYHRDFYALNDVSFEIKKGETVGIIGKNGSGKSTLLKIITGTLNPSIGNVSVSGKISALLELGAGFNPEFTGIENVYLNGTIMGYSREEMSAKLNDILEFADIGEFVNQPVKMYSSGMFVRLAFAVAINVDPEILIVDEALAVGDARFQQKCYAKFESFKKRGKTILFVSHSVESIKMYCDRAILINNGLKVEEGHPRDVVNTYLRMLRDMKLDQEVSNQKPAEVINSTDGELFIFEKSIWYNKNECKYGTNDFGFTRIALYDMSGNYAQEFDTGSYMSIKAEFFAEADVNELYFGFGIRNIQGQDLFVFNGTPKYDNFSIKNIKKGMYYRVKVKMNVFLTPNDYMMTLSLSKIEGEQIIPTQIRYDAITFKVLGNGRSYAGMFFSDLDIQLEE